MDVQWFLLWKKDEQLWRSLFKKMLPFHILIHIVEGEWKNIEVYFLKCFSFVLIHIVEARWKIMEVFFQKCYFWLFSLLLGTYTHQWRKMKNYRGLFIKILLFRTYTYFWRKMKKYGVYFWKCYFWHFSLLFRTYTYRWKKIEN